MKKLIVKIGNETHELPYNGEVFSFEVSDKYVPKVGDCVKIYFKNTKIENFGKINQIIQKEIELKLVLGEGAQLFIEQTLYYGYDYPYTLFTKITPEELKAKYAEAGYDWDYETNTIKWKPKDGDECWVLDSFLQPRSFFYNSSSSWIFKQLEKGLVSPTEAECQKFADHCMSYINNKKE